MSFIIDTFLFCTFAAILDPRMNIQGACFALSFSQRYTSPPTDGAGPRARPLLPSSPLLDNLLGLAFGGLVKKTKRRRSASILYVLHYILVQCGQNSELNLIFTVVVYHMYFPHHIINSVLAYYFCTSLCSLCTGCV